MPSALVIVILFVALVIFVALVVVVAYWRIHRVQGPKIAAGLAAPLGHGAADGTPFAVAPSVGARQLWLALDLVGPLGLEVAVDVEIEGQGERSRLWVDNESDVVRSTSESLAKYTGLSSIDQECFVVGKRGRGIVIVRPHEPRRLRGRFLVSQLAPSDVPASVRVTVVPVGATRVEQAEAFVIAV